MSFEGENSDDDDALFVPYQEGDNLQGDLDVLHNQTQHLQKEIERVEKGNARLTSILAQRQRRTQSLQTQMQLIKGADTGYSLYIEQFRARRQPVWWFILVILSGICVFGAYDMGRWFALAVNIVAHKLLWRRWYVDTNIMPQMIAVCVIAYTLYFVR